MAGEADEAAGLAPGNEENEADCCFSLEKPCLPLSTEGIHTNRILHYTTVSLRFQAKPYLFLAAAPLPFWRSTVMERSPL